MPATAAMNKEEEALFKSMQGEDEAPPAKVDDAGKAAKDAADKAAADKLAADKAAADKAGEKQKNVPHEALHQAREQNKELRKELEGMKTLVAEGDKKLRSFIDSVQKSKDAPPKFEDDPAGALKHENEQLKKDLGEVKERIAKQDESAKQSDSVQRFAALVTAKEKEFAKENTDYFKAADYVAQIWRDEFAEAGFEDEDIPRMVFQKSLAITNKAVQKEKDPAEAIYKIAKRYGFTSKPAPESKEEKKEEKKSEGESKLEQLKKGQDLAKSPGGGTGPDDLTLESLSQMDDETIDKLVRDPDWWAKSIRRSPLH